MVIFTSKDDILLLRENFSGTILIHENGVTMAYTIKNGEIIDKYIQKT